jgi:PAS domain S-box-containing protein
LFDLNDPNIYQILDLINVSIYWKDKNGYYLGCNEYGVKALRASKREDVIGKTDCLILPDADMSIVLEVDKLVLLNGNFTGEEYGVINGERRIFLTTKKKLIDHNGEVIIFGTSIDITDMKKQIELEKRNDEAKMKQIIDLANVSIYWKDLEGRYLGCNKYVSDNIFLNNEKEVIGKTDYELLPKDRLLGFQEADRLTLEKGHFEGYEYGTVHGKAIEFFTSKNRLLDSEGNIIGLIGVSLDVTDRKEVERLKAENEKNKAKLETEKLRLENERYQATAMQQAQFRKIAAQVAHDIASPIFALQMILPRCDVLPENTRTALNKFSTRIIDISQNFLSQFKQKPEDGITINGITKTKASVYIEVIEIVTEKKYEYSNRSIKFISEIDPNSYFTFINVDVDSFKRMMSNIINNSVDALEDKEGIISIYLDTIDDKVQIVIEDNGKGMSKEITDKILRNITITSGKIDGHGIGFSQIRDTLVNNQGSFDIDTELGRGTKIILTFPKIETPKWITDKIELDHDTLVIIVDDEPYVHEAWECKFKLSVPNISKKHFEQGRETIDFLNQLTDEEKKKVFLLIDYELLKQKLNGLEIIQKTNVRNAILVTSHHNSNEIREQAANLGIKILPKELAFAVTIKEIKNHAKN